MSHTIRLGMLVLLLAAVSGCASQQQILDQMQPTAIDTVLNRTRFDWNCPAATSTLISREVVQPVLQGPLVSGIPRAEYTVGVAGCGKRATYVVICPEGGSGCFATGDGPFHPAWQP
jgi:hypothetical protein